MNSPTLLGHVVEVSGPSVSVRLVDTVSSGLLIIAGSTYRVGQVGSFVRIPLGYQDLFGVVSEVGVNATPERLRDAVQDYSRWLRVQLVGESIGSTFERGISQHPNINDTVHIVTERDLSRIYGGQGSGQVVIGRLSSAENIEVCVDLNRLLTRHSASKSTAVASLLRSIASPEQTNTTYPSARVVLLDIHGEYARALADLAAVFRVNANMGEHELSIPYWALDAADLVAFLTGGGADEKASQFFYDKM